MEILKNKQVRVSKEEVFLMIKTLKSTYYPTTKDWIVVSIINKHFAHNILNIDKLDPLLQLDFLVKDILWLAINNQELTRDDKYNFHLIESKSE